MSDKDTIYRQAAIDAFWKLDIELKPSAIDAITDMLKKLPSAQPDCSDCIKHGGDWDCDHVHCHKGESAQPEGWMEKNKERILQAGMEGREVEFWIGGRLFRIREVAQ